MKNPNRGNPLNSSIDYQKKKKKKDPKCHFEVKQSFQLQGLPLTQVRECILKIFMDGNIGNGGI